MHTFYVFIPQWKDSEWIRELLRFPSPQSEEEEMGDEDVWPLLEAIKYLSAKAKQFGERRLKMIARTEATRAFNIGTLEESRSADVVVGYRFDAVLDKNTTDICRARDGKFIPKSDTELLIQNTPPLHVNCRSRLVPITKYDELPKSHMPNTWSDPREIAQQRDYDVAILRQLLQSKAPATSVTQETGWELDDVIETLKNMQIPVKEKYSAAEVRAIMAAIDPDNPRGMDLPIEFRRDPKYPAYYMWWREPDGSFGEKMHFTPGQYDLEGIYHEILHRQYISRTADNWGDVEEGVVDFLAKYIYRKTHPHIHFWVAGYEEAPLKLMLIARSKGGLDEIARMLFRARKQGINFARDESLRFLWQGLSLTQDDYSQIVDMIKKHEKKYRNILSEFLKKKAGIADEDLPDVLDLYMKAATDPDQLMSALGSRQNYYILHAFQSLLLMLEI